MNLGKNVYNLLKRQPQVYVEGLGSFRRNHTPATYDEKRNVYLPPITYIDFDRTSQTGYDFIQYIQQLQLLDRGEAEHEVTAQVAGLLRRVKEDGQVKLDDLGYLVSYGEGYVFKALDLTGFQYEPVEATGVQPQINKEVAEPDVQPEEVSGVTTETEGTPGAEEEKEEVFVEEPSEEQPIAADIVVPDGYEGEQPFEEAKPRSNAIWYVLIVVVALGILIALYMANQNQPAVRGTQNPTALDSNLNTADTTVSSLATDSAQQVDSLGHVGADSLQTRSNRLLVPEHHTWQIVIGSHKTLAQAYEQAESYNKAGYPNVRVIPSNLAKNRKKVIWDSYETKAEADSALRYVQKHHIRDAWPDKIK